MKAIPSRYFNELKYLGHTVARYESNGEVIPFTVSKEYIIQDATTKERLKARCTQNYPCHLKLIKP